MNFGISPKREKDLKYRMKHMKVFEKDLRETFVRSAGPGGQNVNKVATCVVLEHSSGVKVKCQHYRTQGLNRYHARCLLLDKIERIERHKLRTKKAAIAKKKRQNRKRTKAQKQSILETKRKRSQKKDSRRKIHTQKLQDYL